jgi:NitT/TauT family transport system ATP-binding protein
MPNIASVSQTHISVEDVYKSFYRYDNGSKEQINVLSGFSLTVVKYEFLTIFGPNGCGKSTILNIIAGLTPSDAGKITINGNPPEKSRVGFVFQNFQDSLLPWKTVLDNISFPLELKGVRKKTRRKVALDSLDLLGIEFSKSECNAYPYQLSGGQQQLVVIARALIDEPEVLLLDEPFNQLDFQARMSILDKVLDIWEREKITIIFVSHDIEEAIILGDRTALLSNRPARIMEIMENTLPRPRDYNIVQTRAFFNLKNRALTIFGEAIKT